MTEFIDRTKENKEQELKTARELLENYEVQLGDKLIFEGNVEGVVIGYKGIKEDRIVGKKAILLTKDFSIGSWHVVANNLDMKVKQIIPYDSKDKKEKKPTEFVYSLENNSLKKCKHSPNQYEIVELLDRKDSQEEYDLMRAYFQKNFWIRFLGHWNDGCV